MLLSLFSRKVNTSEGFRIIKMRGKCFAINLIRTFYHPETDYET